MAAIPPSKPTEWDSTGSRLCSGPTGGWGRCHSHFLYRVALCCSPDTQIVQSAQTLQYQRMGGLVRITMVTSHDVTASSSPMPKHPKLPPQCLKLSLDRSVTFLCSVNLTFTKKHRGLW